MTTQSPPRLLFSNTLIYSERFAIVSILIGLLASFLKELEEEEGW